MTVKAQAGLGSFITGLALAGLFAILTGANPGNNRAAYIGALAACVVAAIVGLVTFLMNRNN